MKHIIESSIKRIDTASKSDLEMIREAIRGEFEPGKYLRDMGTGAVSGAAAGAVAGAGIGSLPGAAVGAIGGAAFGLGSNAVSDITYQLYGNENKAAWQAGDIQEKLDTIGNMLGNKLNDDNLGNNLKLLGIQYKNYIDIAVKGVNDKEQNQIFQQNVFNPQSEAYQLFQQEIQPRVQQKQSAFNNKFIRIAYEDSPGGLMGGLSAGVIADKTLYSYLKNPQSVTPQVAIEIQKQLQSNPALQVVKQQMQTMIAQGKDLNAWKALDTIPQNWAKQTVPINAVDHADMYKNFYDNIGKNVVDDTIPSTAPSVGQQALQSAGKSGFNPKNILNATLKGAKGLGVGLVADVASNWAVDKIDMAMTGGEINMFRRHLDDIKQIITEINRLTANKDEIVYAGNILWTNLQVIDRMLAGANAQKETDQNTNSSDISQNNVSN